VRARLWLAFAPFAAVALVQLATKLTGPGPLDLVTKSLCVPLLAAGAVVVLVLRRRRPDPVPTALLGVGLLCSFLGDVLIEVGTVPGLGAFLVAHLAYIGMLVTGFRRPIRWWGLAYVAWFAVLFPVLAPHLGALFAPVLVYGAALGGMAAVATRGGILTTLGGLLFVASDTMLALRLFTPALQGDIPKLLVMLTYLAAQSLLVLGMLGRLASWPTPSSNESAPDTSRTRRTRASRSRG
jgi:uncharacterized membrane protein YhhN